MAALIHPTAVVEATAQLGENVEVGAFAYIGGRVVLGTGTKIHHHASVEGDTVLGHACEVFPYANLGAKTQDLKYKGGHPGVRIGDRNVFREYVTIHAATFEGDFTTVGSDNVILAYTHIAHDCRIGNHIVMSNGTMIAGHVHVEDHVVMGGYSGVHQFCRIGAYAMVSACAKVVQDIVPFCIADGQPAVIRSINKVGLERKGFNAEQIERVKQLHKILFREGLNRSQALEKLTIHPQAASAELQRILAFAQTSERGLAPGSS